jgi:DNA repair protein RAD50
LDAIKSLRKEKVAELKTEKEKLDSLSREKGHADKLKGRMAEFSTSIAAKTIEIEEVQELHSRQVVSNAKFYEQSAKFREIYIKVDTLTNSKQHYQAELEDLKVTLQELAGTNHAWYDRILLTVHSYQAQMTSFRLEWTTSRVMLGSRSRRGRPKKPSSKT